MIDVYDDKNEWNNLSWPMTDFFFVSKKKSQNTLCKSLMRKKTLIGTRYDHDVLKRQTKLMI